MCCASIVYDTASICISQHLGDGERLTSYDHQQKMQGLVGEERLSTPPQHLKLDLQPLD